MSLGIYCDKLGIFLSVFDNIMEKRNTISIPKVLFSNGALMELVNELSKKTYHG